MKQPGKQEEVATWGKNQEAADIKLHMVRKKQMYKINISFNT